MLRMCPGPEGCSLSVLNTGPSSEELTGVSDHDPEHIPRVWPMGLSSPTKAIPLSSPPVSLQYTPIELLPASPKGLVLVLVRAMVSMAGVQLCGELWGPPESLLGGLGRQLFFHSIVIAALGWVPRWREDQPSQPALSIPGGETLGPPGRWEGLFGIQPGA